jgi:hypothetical protein
MALLRAQYYRGMKRQVTALFSVLVWFGSGIPAATAHAASGIIVDEPGPVFCLYNTVCKIDAQGKLSWIH